MELPDRTDSLWGWRELWDLGTRPLAAYRRWKYRGDAFQLRTGPQRHCFFYTPEAVSQVLKTHHSRFIRAPRFMRVFSQWNGHSVLIQEGKEWLRTRRLLAPAFSPQRVNRYTENMTEVIERWCAELPAHLETSPATVALTLRVLSASIFGLNLEGASLDALRKTIAELGEIGTRELILPRPVPMWLAPRKRRAIEALRRFVDDLIDARLKGERGDDLLSDLLAATDEAGGLSRTQLRDECMTIMLAGHDTTAAGMAWLLAVLAREPSLADEVAAKDLPFAEQVVRESLRLYPPAPVVFIRQAVEDVEIAGYRVPPGVWVHLPAFVIQRDPRYFPDPERFDPSREHPPFAWFPFGGGPRLCLGIHFALLEMALATHILCQRFRFRMASPKMPREMLRVSLWPSDDLRIELSPRPQD